MDPFVPLLSQGLSFLRCRGVYHDVIGWMPVYQLDLNWPGSSGFSLTVASQIFELIKAMSEG